MILDAADISLKEAEDLDWKLDVDEAKDAKEFAKDVAAMANTAGGLIVYGVREDGADGAAELVGVTNPQPHIQRLRAKATIVRPFIPALRVYSVPLTQQQPGGGTHLIVVEVPRSAEAPHLVPTSKESWGLPRRRDSDTDWLGETDLEAAYAARFRRRQATEDQLQDLAEQMLTHRLLRDESSIWVTVSTVCSVPSTTASTVDWNSPEPSMLAAIDVLPVDNLLRQAFDIAVPKTGLRRALVSADLTYTGVSQRGHNPGRRRREPCGEFSRRAKITINPPRKYRFELMLDSHTKPRRRKIYLRQWHGLNLSTPWVDLLGKFAHVRNVPLILQYWRFGQTCSFDTGPEVCCPPWP
ncbi:helix-turn-helix domain-containing protein [Kitasatospora sp. NPDC018058]|uniref:helix-turn-helix domain-containing protein n=1 Tax=Kitasatospora sp. NPDC018058 TaxID=3364025 RepID=UPI0037BEE7A9